MKILTLILFFVGSLLCGAQVGIGTNSPDSAAVLDIKSQISTGVYGGLKFPTVTLAQRDLITAPIPDGLMIYVKDVATRCLQAYDANGSTWRNWYCMGEEDVATEVSFVTTASTIEEPSNTGNTTDVSLSIVNPSPTIDTTVQIEIDNSSSAESGDYSIIYNGAVVSSPFTVTFPSGSNADQLFTVTALDDGDIDDESLVLNITSIAGGITGATIGANNSHTIIINDDELLKEDFETDGTAAPVRYVQSDTQTSNDSNDYFLRTDGSNINATFTNVTGSYFAAQDIDSAPGVGNSTQEVTFNPINISGPRAFSYSIDLAEDDDNNREDWDQSDYFRVQYRTDGGVWVTILEVNGETFSPWWNPDDREPRITTNVGGTFLNDRITDTFKTFSGFFAASPAATIQFRLAFNLNSANEDIAVDNFIVR